MQQGQSGQSQTGTRDVTYDVVSVMYHALQGVENSRTYAQDAGGDQETKDFFEQARKQQQQLADQAKQILRKCLEKEGGQGGGQGSAFSFNQGQQGSNQSGSSSSMSQSGQGSAGSGGSTTGQTGSSM